MDFREMYSKFGRTEEDIRLDNLEKEQKDKEDVLYDIKDEPDVPEIPPISETKQEAEKIVDSQTNKNLSDDDINKIVELLAAKLSKKEGSEE